MAASPPSPDSVRRTPVSPPVPAPSVPAGRWRRSTARCSAAATAPTDPKARLAGGDRPLHAPCSACPTDWRLGIVPGLRHRRGRDGAVVAARRARRRRAGLGELLARTGSPTSEAAQAEGRAGARRALRQAARPRRRSIRPRRGVRVERHDLAACALPERRLDPARPRGPGDLRRDQRRLRDGAALGQARCRHLVLAEGAGRRGGARHARALAARRGAARKPHAGLAAARRSSA